MREQRRLHDEELEDLYWVRWVGYTAHRKGAKRTWLIGQHKEKRPLEGQCVNWTTSSFNPPDREQFFLPPGSFFSPTVVESTHKGNK